jgi:hypothetical protein
LNGIPGVSDRLLHGIEFLRIDVPTHGYRRRIFEQRRGKATPAVQHVQEDAEPFQLPVVPVGQDR